MGGKTPGSWQRGMSGNPSGRPKNIERMTREEIEAFTWEDAELGTMSGWAALRRRAWLLAMTSDAKDAIRYMQWLDARAHGQPKQQVAVEDAGNAPSVDWSTVPAERRRVLLAALAEIEEHAKPDGPTEH